MATNKCPNNNHLESILEYANIVDIAIKEIGFVGLPVPFYIITDASLPKPGEIGCLEDQRITDLKKFATFMGKIIETDSEEKIQKFLQKFVGRDKQGLYLLRIRIMPCKGYYKKEVIAHELTEYSIYNKFGLADASSYDYPAIEGAACAISERIAKQAHVEDGKPSMTQPYARRLLNSALKFQKKRSKLYNEVLSYYERYIAMSTKQVLEDIEAVLKKSGSLAG